MSQTTRVVQLTFHKCGSQWVRDVLTAPEIVACSQTPLHPVSATVSIQDWPDQPAGTFMGPLYQASHQDWVVHRRSGDKAIVVLRDPRDIIVSMIHSICYSHRSGPAINILREMLLAMNKRHRMFWGMVEMLHYADRLMSWAERETTEWEYVTRYETLINDPIGEYARIVEYLDWPVPRSVLENVVHRLSFEQRSGRAPGEEDIFSHYRRGQQGDWRRHMDKEQGRAWQSILPQVLTRLGYEQSTDWYELLPDLLEGSDLNENATTSGSLLDLQAELARCREENLELKKNCQLQRKQLESLSSLAS